MKSSTKKHRLYDKTGSSFVRLWTLHVVNSVETFDSFRWFVSVTFRRSSLVPRIICLHLDRHFFSFVPSAWNKTLRHLILLTVTIWYCICKALIIIVERCSVHWTFLIIDLPAYIVSFDFVVSDIFDSRKIPRHRHFSRLLFVHFLRAAKFVIRLINEKWKKEKFVNFLSKSIVYEFFQDYRLSLLSYWSSC